MTIFNEGGLRAEIKCLADEVSTLPSRGKATVFAVCGRGLAPLLDLVETRTYGQWVFPEAQAAIAKVEEYVLGLSAGQDHAALRGRLMESVPHGHDLDSPWSTYAQAALTCIDAGLAASSVVDSCKGIWIQYSLDPLVSSLQYRDEDILISRGEVVWEREILADNSIKSVFRFLRKVVLSVQREVPLPEVRYSELTEEAVVLIPAIH
ncbi:hypothetical protein O7608_15665 [Solwaraspora sp. WMMA2056]|uniref:hypothetical protein n=1 Tax=Solwaraspora sp. WMMA2056 TaxID=3015161 RepID=UPI00259B5B80|nr:hypothetical protein [Solwaraspora sp. WMMA2056]WJK43715.1 hypothetical protein O7608_15665 [Solwaraspora sp. WMMA2056]